MEFHTFVADSAAEAVALIRERLGPNAIAVNVRQLPGEGISRLWRKPRIEVVATIPEAETPPAPVEVQTDGLRELREEVASLRRHFMPEPAPRPAVVPEADKDDLLEQSLAAVARGGSQRPLESFLETCGLLPVFSQVVADQVANSSTASDDPLELATVRQTLLAAWREAPKAGRTHVFVGPPGSGKSTLLCKWLAQETLLQGCRARIWQLDGSTVNTSGLVGIYGEILGVEVTRFPDPNISDDDLLFIDLPGVSANDSAGMETLRKQIEQIPGAQVHLVLNLAYDAATLVAQARKFSVLPLTDLSVTHLDEEKRWLKVWNLVFGTKCPVRFLSTGQNIPGDMVKADALRLLGEKLPVKAHKRFENRAQNELASLLLSKGQDI